MTTSSDGIEEQTTAQHRRRGEHLILVLLLCSIVAAVILALVYIDGGQPQLEGVFLFVALAGVGCGLVVWAHRLLPGDQFEEPWHLAEVDEEVEEAEVEALGDTLDYGGAVSRRPMLRRLLLGALGALGLAALFPIRSLGPRPGDDLRTTGWAGGRRMVDEAGRLINVSGVPVGGLVTAFPEGDTGPQAADAAVVLIRLDERAAGEQQSAQGAGEVPAGLIAFSKVCTHAGCPVGLYLADVHTLLCPCHQSEFDVLNDAQPISGPAMRPLPRLSLQVNEAGEIASTGDFAEPAGPSWWTR